MGAVGAGWFCPSGRGFLAWWSGLHRSSMKAAVRIVTVLGLFTGTAFATGPSYSAILNGSGQDFALAVTSDAQGNVYVAGLTYSPDFRVTAGAFQTKFGGTCDAFVAKLGADGKLIWSTYLGGILDDWATGVALDGAGNVLVTGWTRSGNFPLLHPVKSTLDSFNHDDYDAFVAKFDANGTKLVYSTFLGGIGDDGAAGIVADAAGNAVVAVTVQYAAGFPGTPNAPSQSGIVVSKLDAQGAVIFSTYHASGTAAGIALDAAGNIYVAGTRVGDSASSAAQNFGTTGRAQAMAYKLSADGTKEIFATTLGGSVRADGTAIAVNGAGEVYVAGTTSSADFPLAHAFQGTSGARPMWRSADSGVTWTPLDDLPFAVPQKMVADPSNPRTFYMATGDLGVFKSVDGGNTWVPSHSGIAETNVQTLAIDPVHPQTLYAVTAAPYVSTSQYGVYKSVDGANHWALIDLPKSLPTQIAIDPVDSNIVYEVDISIRKSTDGGASWKAVPFTSSVQSLALDPHVSGTIYVVTATVYCGIFCGGGQPAGFFRSVDGGDTWTQGTLPTPANLMVDGFANPAILYDGLKARSVDGGVTWTALPLPPFGSPSAMALDSGGSLYVAESGTNANYISRDHGQTWSLTGTFLSGGNGVSYGPGLSAIVPVGAGGALVVTVGQVSTSGFVTKLSADGAKLIYSTYLRSHPSLEAFTVYAAEPTAFWNENWISAIAVDASGNATVAGGMRGTDLPAAGPSVANAGGSDAFVATLTADGSRLNYSTYFGGSRDDSALAGALDAQGNIILAGGTWSPDFPIPGGVPQPTGYSEVFVVKIAPPGAPRITGVVNGASFQAGIEAGSWVTIQGSGLANTFPGRTWRDEEVVDGKLPTALDGVSVTINGKAAFVYYISPGQINVQAPSDNAVGAVSVVVTNNGVSSAAAPAFFTYLATGNVIASRVADYALLGDPAGMPGVVAAKAGELVILWGTGFGATTPGAAAGSAVVGAPVVVTTPVVTVGGAPAAVISAVLTTGDAGLYQVTIQVPAGLPGGAAAVRATVGGVATQAGVVLFVGK